MKKVFLLPVLLLTLTIPLFAQYDESKVPAYTLPELLRSQDGKAITTRKQWEKIRRPELLSIFTEQVYGKTPTQKLPLKFEVTSVDPNALAGKATRKEITVFFSEDKTKRMNILLYLPNGSTKPVPVFLGLNFVGNQAINADPGISITTNWVPERKELGIVNHRATEASRAVSSRRWEAEYLVSQGYAVATIYCGDLQPDRANSFADGVAPLFYKDGQTNPLPDEWGTLGIWAWGLSRALDYLETDKQVNAKKVAVVGHSRLGKAALWAGAQDKRFAIVISNNSGEGGAAITRRKYGETITKINTAFPHWFAGNYKSYNDREEALPVDYHQLLALMAPRPVYVASASEDQWADPKGEYLSAYHASPAYALYGLKGLTSPQPPAASQPVGDGAVGYHMREGKHDILLYDWQQYVNFANRHFK
jgi:hypothetical protein